LEHIIEEANMKNIILTTTAIITLSATSVFANGITFDQSDTVGVSNLSFAQSAGGGNNIDLDLSGGMTSVVIDQTGPEVGDVSSGNTATVDLNVNSAVTQFDSADDATRGDGWKTFSATFDGDNNALAFNLGTQGDATQYSDVDVDIAVSGDGNDLTHTIANGLVGETLQFGGSVNGDDNTVVATLGAVGDIAFNYTIAGDTNKLTATLAGPSTGGRTVDIALNGNSNVWTATSNASGGILNVAANGSSISGTNSQSGVGANLQLEVNKVGMTAFAVTTTQTGANSYADVTINATDGGAFTLTQSSANASYVGAINLGAGGAATITQ
jgi:hypothetical protein